MRSVWVLAFGVTFSLLGLASTGPARSATLPTLLLSVGGLLTLIGSIGLGVTLALHDVLDGRGFVARRSGGPPAGEPPTVDHPAGQRVLDALWDTESEAQRRPSVLAARLGMTRSDLRPTLTSLEHAGLVTRDPVTGHYDVAPATDGPDDQP